VRLDDDLMDALKERAHREDVSLTKLMNRALREWLAGGAKSVEARKKAFRQKTYNMGRPLVDLTKALALSAALEDEAIIEKLSRGK
jgi:hypothetical protein